MVICFGDPSPVTFNYKYLAEVSASEARGNQSLGRVIIDPVNLTDGEPPDRGTGVLTNAFRLLAKDIVVAHAKDVLTYGYPATPGKAVRIDYHEYLRLLQDISFCGALLIHSVTEPQLARTIRFLREMIQRLGIGLESS